MHFLLSRDREVTREIVVDVSHTLRRGAVVHHPHVTRILRLLQDEGVMARFHRPTRQRMLAVGQLVQGATGGGHFEEFGVHPHVGKQQNGLAILRPLRPLDFI